MARINTNVGAVVAQRHLSANYRAMNATIQRLSSGLRINRGADDPAGLIASERLRAEISAVGQAISNTQRASNIIATSEGALDEIARLITDIQDLVVGAANEGAMSSEEIEANQLQIDSAIESITRIANSTTFAGRQLLNGSLDYVTSGVSGTAIDALAVHSVNFGTASYLPVNVDVVTSATPARLYFPYGSITSATTIEIQGTLGAATIPIGSGSTAAQIAQAINLVSDATGVVATLSATAASGFVLQSSSPGSKHFVSVLTLPGGGAFNTTDAAGNPDSREIGRDAVALINGAATLGDGNHLTVRTSTLDMEMTLDPTFGAGSTSFAITGGGALFQVGPEVNSALQVNIGIPSVAASRLGNSAVGFLSQIVSGGNYAIVTGHAQDAQRIVEQAINQVAILRGRLGAFERNTLDTNVNQLGITMENLMASESAIRDADFAHETSELSRNQILVSSGTSVLALAQQTPQSILGLLQ